MSYPPNQQGYDVTSVRLVTNNNGVSTPYHKISRQSPPGKLA